MNIESQDNVECFGLGLWRGRSPKSLNVKRRVLVTRVTQYPTWYPRAGPTGSQWSSEPPSHCSQFTLANSVSPAAGRAAMSVWNNSIYCKKMKIYWLYSLDHRVTLVLVITGANDFVCVENNRDGLLNTSDHFIVGYCFGTKFNGWWRQKTLSDIS